RYRRGRARQHPFWLPPRTVSLTASGTVSTPHAVDRAEYAWSFRVAGSLPMVDPVPFITYTFVMSITPGPNNVMLTVSGARFGFRRTVPHMLGIGCGFIVQLLAVCAGLSALFTRWPALQSTLAWVGAAYLLYLGWQMLGPVQAESREAHRPVTFLHAALLQILNPQAWV